MTAIHGAGALAAVIEDSSDPHRMLHGVEAGLTLGTGLFDLATSCSNYFAATEILQNLNEVSARVVELRGKIEQLR